MPLSRAPLLNRRRRSYHLQHSCTFRCTAPEQVKLAEAVVATEAKGLSWKQLDRE
jgi:hypothetical protein